MYYSFYYIMYYNSQFENIYYRLFHLLQNGVFIFCYLFHLFHLLRGQLVDARVLPKIEFFPPGPPRKVLVK